MLGRPGSSRARRDEEDDVSAARPDRHDAVQLDRAPPRSVGGEAARILDDTMNYSPNYRTGRIDRGVYRGKTAPEAALAAQREARNRARDRIGGGDVGRIGSDRSDYQVGGGTNAPFNRASAGLDRLNENERAARGARERVASGDRRGVSVWRNNGDGTATSGSYDANNQFQGQRRDIVERVSPGQTSFVQRGAPLPKGRDADTHLTFEDTAEGTKVTASKTPGRRNWISATAPAGLYSPRS